MTTLYVHLNAHGRIDWKPAGVKGARWHSNLRDLDAALDDATNAGIPYPRTIDYVDAAERTKL